MDRDTYKNVENSIGISQSRLTDLYPLLVEAVIGDDVEQFKKVLYSPLVREDLMIKITNNEYTVYKGVRFNFLQGVIGYNNAMGIYNYLISSFDGVFSDCIKMYLASIVGDNFYLFKRITFETNILEKHNINLLFGEYGMFDWPGKYPQTRKYIDLLTSLNIPKVVFNYMVLRNEY